MNAAGNGPVRPPDVTLVLPCYQEESHLEASVQAIFETLDRTCWRWEVVFVEDASRDGTRALIERILARNPERCLRALFHERNTGRGRAVTDGIRAASGEIVGYMDVDLEVSAHYLPAFVAAIERGADVATGWRIYKLRPLLFHRALLSRGYVHLVNSLLGVSFPDTEAGYKFFRRRRILSVLDSARDPGWFWDTEIVVLAALAGLRVESIPVLFLRRYDKKSTVRVFRDTLAYLRSLRAFRVALRRRLETVERAPVAKDNRAD